MKTILMASLGFVLVLVLPVIALADPQSDALLRIQQRNAGIVGGLVNQTPEYQHGHALRVEAVKQQEQATAERNQRWEDEAAQNEAARPNQEREQERKTRNEKIDQLYNDMPHGKLGDRGRRETAQNQIDTLQRENGVYVPPRPERPKPRMPSTFFVNGKQFNCVGNVCR